MAGRGQHEFLIAPAFARAGDMDRRFAARHDAHGTADAGRPRQHRPQMRHGSGPGVADHRVVHAQELVSKRRGLGCRAGHGVAS